MKPLIMFVDDEPSILKSFQRLFRDSPYEVLTLPDPVTALERLKTVAPDIIVSDYRMPGMDGVTFLQAAAEKSPDAVRILLTGYADVGTAQEAINDAHVYRFLTKPWNDIELVNTIQSALYSAEERQRKAAETEAEQESNKLLKTINEELQVKLRQQAGFSVTQERQLKAQLGATARGLLTALAQRFPQSCRTDENVAFAVGQTVELAGEHWLRDTAILTGWMHEIGLLADNDQNRSYMAARNDVRFAQLGARILEASNFPPKVAS